ncbi:MAG TPA: alpha/beta hydrolase fold domain-containing protein [Anaerolineaceae bacterium]|nr:alpha/beta hydrolase fold domain-containing protein [Anaerolineaceae bacterium]
MINLRGNLWYMLRCLFIFFSSAIYVTVRRLVRGRRRPSWSWLVEVAIFFLRQQIGQASRLKRVQDQRAFNDALGFRPSFGGGMKIKSERLGERPARRFIPGQTNHNTMLYLHGGGYAFYNRMGDQLIGQIARAAQAETLVPDYRLAPEHPYPAALEDAVEAYRSLIVSGIDPQRLIVAGDSAGGGLALAMLLRARGMGLKMPALVILLCPWVDLNCTGKSMKTNAPYDFITYEQLRAWSNWYAGANDLSDPFISPTFAKDLKGLPPILIQSGKDEILYDSIVEFSSRAKAQGAEVLLEIYPEMPHDFQSFADLMPQSAQALQRIRREVWRRLPDTPPQVTLCLPDLAIFRADTPIPQRVFDILWAPLGLSSAEIQDVLDWLLQRQRIGNPATGVYSLAAYQLTGLEAQNLPERHQRLLRAYRALCRGGWPGGPRDGYYFQNLTYHLKGAGWQEELARLLLNFDWLWARLNVTDIAALIRDFGFLEQHSEDHQLVLEALRLSQDVLVQDKTQLAAQLRGRLLWIVKQLALAPRPAQLGMLTRLRGAAAGAPPLPRLLDKAVKWKEAAWMCPLNTCLIAPNGPKEGRQTSPGLAVVISANYQRALAVVDGRTIQVWDVARGEIIAELRGHTGMIFSLAIDARGNMAVSAGEDSTVRVWDLDTGRQRFMLGGHVGRVWAVALTPSGKTAVSVGEDGVLRVWDVRKGCEKWALRGYESDINRTSSPEDVNPIAFETLRGHTRGAWSVSVTSNGKNAVSGGPDGTVRVWDLKVGQELYAFKGHKTGIVWVGISWHGRRAFSVSHDRQLKVWDLDRKRLMHTFEWPLLQPKAVQDAVKDLLKVLRVPSLEKAVEAMRTAPQSGDVARVIDNLMKALHFPHLNMMLDSLMDVLNVTSLPAAMDALARQRNVPAVAQATYHLMDALDVPSLDKAPQALQASLSDAEHALRVPFVKTALGELLDALNAPALGLEKAIETVLAAPNDMAFAVAIDASLAVLPIQPHVLQLENLETGKRRSLGSHARPIWAAAIDSDGTQAVSASLDSTLKLWDLASGECLTTYYCNGEVTFVAMSPYGQLIVAGDQAGFLHFLRPVWPG